MRRPSGHQLSTFLELDTWHADKPISALQVKHKFVHSSTTLAGNYLHQFTPCHGKQLIGCYLLSSPSLKEISGSSQVVTDDQFTTVPCSCRHIYALVCNNFEFDGASKGSAYTSFFLRTRLYMQLGQHELSSMKTCITKQCQDRFQFSLQEGCRKNQYMSCSTLTRKQHSYGLRSADTYSKV